jgi:hypothetical protein
MSTDFVPMPHTEIVHLSSRISAHFNNHRFFIDLKEHGFDKREVTSSGPLCKKIKI